MARLAPRALTGSLGTRRSELGTRSLVGGLLFFGFWCLVAWLGKQWAEYEMRLVERRRDVPSGMSEARERGAGGGGAAQGMEVFGASVGFQNGC